MFTKKSAFAILLFCLVTLLVVTPILANNFASGGIDPIEQRGDKGKGGGNGNGQPQPTAEATISNMLGCQKNNPERLDCSSLEVSGYCDGSTAVFTITNTGSPGDGDMRAATPYRLVVDGVVVQSGVVQLAGGTSMQVTYSGSGSVTLEADQQVGHPGNSHPRTTLNCTPATEPPQPTVEVTPTEEVVPPVFNVVPYCEVDGRTSFVISNSGGVMLADEPYVVMDVHGALINQGAVLLASGESVTLSFFGEQLTLTIAGQTYYATTCYVPTEEVTPTDEPTLEVTPTEEVTPEETVAPPVFNVVTNCASDGSTVFTIYNDGGDMLTEMWYMVADQYGTVVAEGTFILTSGQSWDVMASGTGLTLSLDGVSYSAQTCYVPTEEVTPEETTEPPVFYVAPGCASDGSTVFTIYNNGGDMLTETWYMVTDQYGTVVAEGTVMLAYGESMDLTIFGTNLMLSLDGATYSASTCYVPTEEVTPEVTPDAPILNVAAYCTTDGGAIFTITNDGGDMLTETWYMVTDQYGTVVTEGTLMLANGQSLDVSASGPGLTLSLGGIAYYATTCYVPTDEPTPEVTPTDEPTPEVTPTDEPTPVPTDSPLACQKNNPDRLDCSSLRVGGSCDANTAVFTIGNTGEAGNGGMRAPTVYAIFVDGVLVETGSVDLNGGDSMQVSYEGSGAITLIATQQVGHPGKSQPQATVNCA